MQTRARPGGGHEARPGPFGKRATWTLPPVNPTAPAASAVHPAAAAAVPQPPAAAAAGAIDPPAPAVDPAGARLGRREVAQGGAADDDSRPLLQAPQEISSRDQPLLGD